MEVCGETPAVEHSTRDDTSPIEFGKFVEYHCDTGHSVDGKVGCMSNWVTTCLANGIFRKLDVQTNSYTALTTPTFRRVCSSTVDVKCGADGESIQLGSCSPVSFGQPTSITNNFVDIREYVFSENASYTCGSGCTTTGVPSGVTSFT